MAAPSPASGVRGSEEVIRSSDFGSRPAGSGVVLNRAARARKTLDIFNRRRFSKRGRHFVGVEDAGESAIAALHDSGLAGEAKEGEERCSHGRQNT